MRLTVHSAAFAASLALCAAPAAAGGGGMVRPVVVELYTSQGCSSCPPADALLGKLAQRTDVIAMSLPITYWDMLGWKDTLASDANTRRQKAYAAAMGHGGVYTPQIIVDGVLDVVGSRGNDLTLAIAQRQGTIETATATAVAQADAARVLADAARNDRVASRTDDAGERAAARAAAAILPAAAPAALGAPATPVDISVPVAVTETPTELHIDLGEASGAHNATVWLFHLRSQVSVNIPAGENQGHTITYHNVVGDLRAVGVWKGPAATLTLPRNAMAGLPHDGIAVVVQQGGYGHVIGAAYVSRPAFYAIR